MAVKALTDLLDWWNGLGEVEKASKTVISHLVITSERIIADEQGAWTSTATSDEKEGSAAPTSVNDDAGGEDAGKGKAKGGSSAKVAPASGGKS